MSKFVILLGGEVTPCLRLLRQLDGSRVIAADGGMAHARTLKLVPELWIGDFDSTSKALGDHWHNVPRQTHPVKKDDSDGELAIAEALRRGATSLVLVGGMGGQLDHVLAHAGFLLSLAARDIAAMMTTGTEEAYALVNSLTLKDIQAGTRVSVMPFSDLTGLSISGVKWPLSMRDVKLGTARTLANVATGAVKMSLQAGNALVLTYPVAAGG